MNIIILYGGRSGEHEVSLVSASSVARNAKAEHALTLIGITGEGLWFRQPQSEVERIRADKDAVLSIKEDASQQVSLIPGGGRAGAFTAGGSAIPCDIVLPMLHGTYGEDGTVQGLLEMLDVPYTGCGVGASAVTMDKEFTKRLCEQAGLPVVPYVCLSRHDISDYQNYDELIEKTVEQFGYPLFVKPCTAGSSDGANKASNYRELSMALMDAFQWDDKVLIEKAVDAREIECAVTGNTVNDDFSNESDCVRAYILGEIVPKKNFYDYDAKYNDPDGAELLVPANLDKHTTEKVRSIAVKAYETVNAAGMSRVDFLLDRMSDKLYLNEINSIPGFTPISMFPKLCTAAALPYPDIIELLLSQGLHRYEARKRLRTKR